MLKTTNYEGLKNINPENIPGTCQWFLQDPKYKKWLANEDEILLWLSADPGCGKSVLSRCLIDKELKLQESTMVCYFFFKDNDEQNTLTTALCAVLHQLFSTHPELISHVVKAWEKNKKMLATDTAELWRVLVSATCDQGFPSVICILDAVDECKEKERQELFNLLSTLSSSPKSEQRSLKFFITSRPYGEIEDGLLDCPKIQLSGEEMNEDIHKEIDLVIKHKVAELVKAKTLKESNKTQLEEWLLAMKHRTYLWLYLAFDGIQKAYKDDLQPDLIHLESLQLPATVDEAYENILKKSSKPAWAKLILTIIIGARRPLKIPEMAIALGLGTREGSTPYRDFRIDESDLTRKIRNICGLFIFIQDSTVYLIHQTAKEFIISRDPFDSDLSWKGCLSLTKTEEVMARICVDFLSLDEFDGLDSEMLKIYHGKIIRHGYLYQRQDSILTLLQDKCSIMNAPGGSGFLEYAAVHWNLHVRNCVLNDDEELLQKVWALYQVKDNRSHLWFDLLWDTLWRHFNRPTRIPAVMDKIQLAAFSGHVEILDLLKKRGELNVDSKDTSGRTALCWAVILGHEAAVKFLIENGANLNLQYEFWGSVLMASSYQGYTEIVSLLLQAGADVNAQVIDVKAWLMSFDTALQAASYQGHVLIVDLLLKGGADVNALSGSYGNALQAACSRGHMLVVELLLKGGADVNAQDGEGGNALQAASGIGHVPMVELLFKSGADVNAQGGSYGNALQAACSRGHMLVVELLLKGGADVNAQDGEGGNALQAASGIGHVPMVELLFKSGADVNAQGGYFGNALQEACSQGHMLVVEQLLKSGARVNARGGKYGTALLAATMNGHATIAQLLIHSGPDVHAMGSKSCSALQASWVKKHEILKQLLQEKVAILNEERVDNLGCSMIHCFAKGDSYAVIEFTLNNGFIIDTPDHQGWTPSHWCAYFGGKNVALFLREKGANLSLLDWQGWTPAQLAAFAGHREIAAIFSTPDLTGHEIQPSLSPGQLLRGYCCSCYHVRLHYRVLNSIY